jgi:phosphopantothenoylcysteine synthetase/decarboxylase
MLTATSTDLTALVRRLIDDPSTSTAIRNECHRLLIAIDRNHRMLIEERLQRLTQLLEASDIKTSRQGQDI